jgi:isopenicillin N synthase-like dioxygenase
MPNIWLPDGVLPGFKEACLDFFWDCFRLELTILRALAMGLCIREDYFLDSHTVPDNQLRLLHYPPTSRASLESGETVRIGAHADFGSITLLFQDDVGGLEVEDPQREGVFLPVPPVPGAVIVNAGDFLMRWSNDIIKSTVHRVRAPPDSVGEDGMTPARYSIPYFCAPDLTQVVDCIPGTWDENRPKKYEPTSAMDYILKRLAANYGD